LGVAIPAGTTCIPLIPKTTSISDPSDRSNTLPCLGDTKYTSASLGDTELGVSDITIEDERRNTTKINELVNSLNFFNIAKTSILETSINTLTEWIKRHDKTSA
jgi:hypothetical protein